jgi:hypothetical protein
LDLAGYFFLVYGACLTGFYFAFFFIAKWAVLKNKQTETFMDVEDISNALDVPSVCLIAPAYNEGKTIVSNVKSLLT